MILAKVLASFLLGYFFLCLYLYIFQEKQIFFPPPKSNVFEGIPVENRISLEINDINISGIYSGKLNNEKPLIIYFGGNAEDVFYNYLDFKSELNAQFVAFNYRGFAGNEGKPTITAILRDMKALLTQLINDYSLKPSNIILMGRSLGAGIAVQLSKEEEFSGVILVSPFDSMVNIAKRYFSWFPVSILLKHPLDSLSIAKQSSKPLLILAAEKDQIIPISHSQALFDAWSAKDKQINIINNAGHNDIHSGKNYYVSINQFLDRIKRIN